MGVFTGVKMLPGNGGGVRPYSAVFIRKTFNTAYSMASNLKNLSVFDRPVPSAAEMSFGIVVAEWNHAITSALLDVAIATLRAAGCPEEKISVKWVPGTFELAMGAQYFAEYTNVDAVIVLGCVIQGDTRHFDFVCQGVTQGVQQMQLSWNMPIAFGVLTTNDQQQALDRAGGKLGNKGDEAAATAIKMVALQREMELEDNGEAAASGRGSVVN